MKIKESKTIFAIAAAGMWINLSEFLRNEILLKSIWTRHYTSLGLTFVTEPKHAAAWMLWGFLYSVLIYSLSKSFTKSKCVLLSWTAGFAMMWIVTLNLGVLPLGILPFALPLSVVETWIALAIIKKILN